MEKAHIIYGRQEWYVDSGLPIRDTLQQIGLDPEQVVPLRNRQVLASTDVVMPGDEIKLVNIISGG